MGFPKCIDTILNWTELNYCCIFFKTLFGMWGFFHWTGCHIIWNGVFWIQWISYNLHGWEFCTTLTALPFLVIRCLIGMLQCRWATAWVLLTDTALIPSWSKNANCLPLTHAPSDLVSCCDFCCWDKFVFLVWEKVAVQSQRLKLTHYYISQWIHGWLLC